MNTLPELPEHIMVTSHLKALIFPLYPIIFPPRFQNQKQERENTYLKFKERGCVCASSAVSSQIPSIRLLLNVDGGQALLPLHTSLAPQPVLPSP